MSNPVIEPTEAVIDTITEPVTETIETQVTNSS